MEVSFEKIKEIMEKYCYFAEDELIWQTYININKFIYDGQIGQDIHAICLEGPPGSGKTEYTKIYKKVLKDILDEDVELISYQCDSSTGKSELYEEIRVSAAIAGKPDEVIISGKLVEAIDSVNSGKKVILFLDEYDKAREETDALLLQFLQEGKINTTQRGNVEIKPENLGNIHVILCKNQMREELSGPLERRVKIIRLSEMKPVIFHEVAKRQLPNADPNILNAVSILYGKLYDEKDNYARIPCCSESLMAIQDACTLLKARAPREFICSAIISNMLKNPNDIETFKYMLSKDEQLADFFKECCQSTEEGELTENEKLRRKLISDFFSDDIKRISEDIERVNRELYEVNVDHKYLEGTLENQKTQLANKEKLIQEQQAILKKLLASSDITNPLQTQSTSQQYTEHEFIKVGDEHKFIRTEGITGEILDNPIKVSDRRQMDKSVFDFSEENWSEIGTAILRQNTDRNCMAFDADMIERLTQQTFSYCDDSKMCKDGFVIYNRNGITIVGIRVIEEKEDSSGNPYYEQSFKFFANKLAIPIFALNDLMKFTHEGCYHGLNCSARGLFLDCLVSGEEKEINESRCKLEEIEDNLYHLVYKNADQDLEDASQRLQKTFNLSNYFNSKYDRLRRMLERLAINKHRDMVVDGRIKSEYVLPIEKVKGFDKHDDNDEKTF